MNGPIADSAPESPTLPEPESPVISSSEPRSRLFISYKRGVEPDEKIALEIYRELSKTHQVFIDQTMPIGTAWAERIEQELKASDFLITFLSEQAVHSEMVLGEIETAHKLMKETGQPKILPVRLGYKDSFVYPLSAYLNPINWALWEGKADTPRLIEELRQAIAGSALSIARESSKQQLIAAADPSGAAVPRPHPSAQPVRLEAAEGTMDPESGFYVERSADQVALAAIAEAGVTITIKGPRQMGKSSLLMRVIDRAMKAGKQVAYLDFQLFDQEVLDSADKFYRQFSSALTEALNISDRVDEHWQEGRGNPLSCTRYMQNHVLKEVGGPLVLAMDEVDRMFDAGYRSDFFSMLRGWHNNRALPMLRIWKQFDLALVTATEPYHLIANLNQSPFNVGEVILLSDFTAAQLSVLNQRHGSPLRLDQESLLMAQVHGHPYLVRKALYLLASGQMEIEQLLEEATTDGGPFGDHLRYHLFRIFDKPELVQGLLQVIRSNRCPDERIARLLVAAGLARKEDEKLLPRCQLYTNYFGERLHG